jgi:hypothetical protein
MRSKGLPNVRKYAADIMTTSTAPATEALFEK